MGFFLQSLILFFLPFAVATSGPEPFLFPHPFYVAVTEVTQNTTEKSLEISCKFFADDFEETLRNVYTTKLDINSASAQEKATFDRLIPDYINKHLLLAANGKPLKLSYVGFERDKESVYCYFEVAGVPAIKNLQANNTLLHDFKKEQINIMHVTVAGKRQSTKLDFPEKQAQFQFN